MKDAGIDLLLHGAQTEKKKEPLDRHLTALYYI
jgi:hypothetical protein